MEVYLGLIVLLLIPGHSAYSTAYFLLTQIEWQIKALLKLYSSLAILSSLS